MCVCVCVCVGGGGGGNMSSNSLEPPHYNFPSYTALDLDYSCKCIDQLRTHIKVLLISTLCNACMHACMQAVKVFHIIINIILYVALHD